MARLSRAGPRSTWAEEAPAQLSSDSDGLGASRLGGRGGAGIRGHFTPAMLDLTPQPPRLSSRPPSAAGVCTDGSETLIAPGASARGTGKRPASERDASKGAVSAGPRRTRASLHARRSRPRPRTWA